MGRECNLWFDWAIVARYFFSYKAQLYSRCKLDELKMMNPADCFLCCVWLYEFRGLVVFFVLFLGMLYNPLNVTEARKIQEQRNRGFFSKKVPSF